jgi:hypothetical protein
VSDEDFESSEVTRKNNMADEKLEGTEDWHWNVDSALRVDCPDLPIPASPRTLDSTPTVAKYYSK